MKSKKIQNNKIFKIPNKTAGFTLVESLFAVLILTFTITGLMTIVSNSLFSARYAKDEITVSYLMQEVVDSIRNDRDTTVFLGTGSGLWDAFVARYNNCTTLNKGCYFDVSKPSIKTACSSAPSGVCPVLYYDDTPDTSFYNYVTSSPNMKTNFQRIIYVDKNPNNPDELIVKVEVHWKNGSVPVTRTLSASFLNWRK